MIMDWLKKAPTALVITLLVIVAVTTLAYLGGFIYLSAHGVDTTDYRGLLNTAFNYLGILFGATTTVASVAAARSSSNAEDAGNGKLTEKEAEIKRLRGLLAARPTDMSGGGLL